MTALALANQVAVVTGASSGVGRAIARAYAEAGAKVALIARNPDGLNAAAREVRQLGAAALVLPLDVADSRAVESAANLPKHPQPIPPIYQPEVIAKGRSARPASSNT